jgi:hypothetical protein
LAPDIPIYSDTIKDADRVRLGLPVPDRTKTPVPPPTAQAVADIGLPGIHELELKIHPMAAVPVGASRSDYGVRVYYGILGDATATDKFRLASPAASGGDLPHSVFTRKAKKRFDFPEEDRAKHVYFCLRYENAKDESGPWGPILDAIIP